jgi:LuxR family transcriptional regulator, maltose regulon positive regulatory protein
VRRRLLDRLDRGVERPLTMIAAPPGAGKTALVASWITSGRPPGPVAWLSLDAADGDRRRFWAAVLDALTRAGVDVSLTTLPGRPQERVELFLSALAGAMAGRAEPLVLVLDDFH